MKEGDEWKAIVRMNQGLFEPVVMFFGLTNSPTTFQMMMNDIFRHEMAEGWVVIYMDDILVFSKNEKEHETHIQKILAKLREHKLSLKLEKCWFSKREIKFLGLIISEDSIKMDPGKVQAIKEWPVPTVSGLCLFTITQFSKEKKERNLVVITVIIDNLKTSRTLPTTLPIYLMPHVTHVLSSCPRV